MVFEASVCIIMQVFLLLIISKVFIANQLSLCVTALKR